MIRVSKWFLDQKLYTKLILVYSMVIVLVFTISGVLFYGYFSRLIEKNALENMNNSVTVLTAKMNELIDDIFLNTVNIATTDEFSAFLKDSHYGNSRNFATHYGNLQAVINRAIVGNKLIKGIIIVGRDHSVITNASAGYRHKPLENFIWFNDETIGTGMNWLSQSENFLLNDLEEVIPIIIPLKYDISDALGHFVNISDDKPDAYLVFTLGINEFVSTLVSMNLLVNSEVYIVDANLRPINEYQENRYYETVTNVLQENQNHIDDEHIIVMKELKRSELKVVNIISKNVFFNEVNNVKTYIIIVALALMFMTVIVSHRLSLIIMEPLKKLFLAMSSIKGSNYKELTDVFYNDEIGALSQAYNKMIAVINAQMKQIVEDEQRKRESEMRILIEQINPHLIYNTFDAIQWQIRSGKAESAAFMTERLGKLLRLSLNNGKEMTTLAKEIDHAKYYVEIINNRFEGMLSIKTKLPIALQQKPIIKLVLQPLVENSIKHGFSYNDANLNTRTEKIIQINCSIDEKNLYIDIVDNGIGFDCEMMESKIADASNGSSNSIGLSNVYNRLMLCYGDKVRFSFSSIPYYHNAITIVIEDYVIVNF